MAPLMSPETGLKYPGLLTENAINQVVRVSTSENLNVVIISTSATDRGCTSGVINGDGSRSSFCRYQCFTQRFLGRIYARRVLSGFQFVVSSVFRHGCRVGFDVGLHRWCQ